MIPVIPGKRPSWLRNPIRRYKDKLRFLYGRSSNTNYVRLFPNFGFLLTLGSRQFRYSRHRGYASKKVS
jgi:hypothetical protein